MKKSIFLIVRFFRRFPLLTDTFYHPLLQFDVCLQTDAFMKGINSNLITCTSLHINILFHSDSFKTKTTTPWLILLRKGKQFYRFYDVKS